MKKRTMMLSAVALAGVVCGSCVGLVQAGTRRDGFGATPRGGAVMEKVRTWLAIDDVQAARIKTALERHKDDLIQARDFSLKARVTLVDTLVSNGHNEQAVRQAWRTFAVQVEDAVVAAAGTMADVKTELTPAQRERCAKTREHLRNIRAAKLDMWRDIRQPLSQGE